jgi:hypothetical protein
MDMRGDYSGERGETAKNWEIGESVWRCDLGAQVVGGIEFRVDFGGLTGKRERKCEKWDAMRTARRSDKKWAKRSSEMGGKEAAKGRGDAVKGRGGGRTIRYP